ncbi:MAG: hypothetical protein GY906_18955 [bacterium]|nr:hypothetical protein [bacterium]
MKLLYRRCSILFIVAAVCVLSSADTQAQVNRNQESLESMDAGSKVPSEYFVMAAANLTGFGGVKWQTDLEISIDVVRPVGFTIVLLPRDQDNSSPQEKTFVVDWPDSVRLENVLESVFNYQGAATLQIKSSSGEHIIVFAQTYAKGPNGTHGMYTPTLMREEAIDYDQWGRLMLIRQSASDTEGFRTNLGLFNPNDFPVLIGFACYAKTDSGQRYGNWFEVTIGPYESKQYDKILRMLSDEEDMTGLIDVFVGTSGGSVFAYATPVNNETGDGSHVPARVLDISYPTG